MGEELQLNSLRGLTSLANRLINCTGSAAELPTLVSLLAHLGVLVREGTVEAEGSVLELLELSNYTCSTPLMWSDRPSEEDRAVGAPRACLGRFSSWCSCEVGRSWCSKIRCLAARCCLAWGLQEIQL